MTRLSDLACNFADSVSPATVHGQRHVHVECNDCGQRFMRYGFLGRECPVCGSRASSQCEPEGDREEMCARHWLLEGVRDGSCAECLGADIPDGRAAVIVTDENGVAFAGGTGPLGLLAPLSELARVKEIGAEPGDVLATFPPDDPGAIEICASVERQATLTEKGADP